MSNYSLNTISSANQPTSKDAGMENGKHSKKIVQLMDNIISANAQYNQDEHLYQLDYQDLSDLDKEALLAQLMIDHPDIGSEATGPDNDLYNDFMLPALIKVLQDSTNQENRLDFIDEWKKGVSSYASHTISDLLYIRLKEYNMEYAQDAREELCSRW